jgi:RNA recognition motif-containing protein
MSNSKLYVGNLSFKTTEDELRAAFGQFGSVTDVYVAMDKMTGRPRGFAFVTMGTADEAKQAAEKMNGVDLGGRQLTVNEARPKEERPGGGFGGGGGGRGFGGGGGGRGGFGGGGGGRDRDRGERRYCSAFLNETIFEGRSSFRGSVLFSFPPSAVEQGARSRMKERSFNLEPWSICLLPCPCPFSAAPCAATHAF